MNKKTMNNEKLIDDIVAMLDGSMEKGTGHVNIKVDDDNLVQMEQVNKSDARMSLRLWKLLAVLHVHDKLQF